MESLDTLYNELFAKVIEDDEETQRYYLSVVETHRKIPVDYLLSQGALFIPNNDYIYHYLGSRAINSFVGLYYDRQCVWTLFVILPVRDLSGQVVGITGWDAYNKYKEVAKGEQGLASYKVSAKSVFSRDKYFLSDVDCLRRQFDKRVVFVTDGVFDSVSLNYRGIPTVALLGSTFSREIIYFLSWYKHVYVCADNDRAGVNLVKKLSKSVPNVHAIQQDKCKDIEELLRGDGVDGPVSTQLRALLDNPVNGDYTILSNSSARRFRPRVVDVPVEPVVEPVVEPAVEGPSVTIKLENMKLE